MLKNRKPPSYYWLSFCPPLRWRSDHSWSWEPGCKLHTTEFTQSRPHKDGGLLGMPEMWHVQYRWRLLTDYPEVIAWIPISGRPTIRELSRGEGLLPLDERLLRRLEAARSFRDLLSLRFEAQTGGTSYRRRVVRSLDRSHVTAVARSC